MNQNTEYERFTQEIYQQLVDSDVVKATTVQHNVKLIGRSGQKHQIDVYWEYEIAGNMHKVAIECKNYNKSVPLSVVQGFKGVLVSVSAILSCRPFFILIFLPCIKMNHYGFSRKSIWKNLETFP